MQTGNKTNFVCPWQAGNFDPERPYNVCATCVYREDEFCDGPNYAFLTGERRCEVLQTRLAYLKQREPGKWTYKYVANGTLVSEPTVVKIVTDPEYNPTVDTFATVVHFIMGGSKGKFPCAMMALALVESEPVEMELTSLLEKLAEKDATIARLRNLVDTLQGICDFLRAQVGVKDNYIAEFWSLVKELQEQLKHLREELK